MIRVLIFDFDGLILDTESPDYVSWQAIFQSYGVTLAHEFWATHICSAHTAFDVYAYLAEQSGQTVEREAVRAQRLRQYNALVAQQAVLPGVLDYLTRAPQLGLRLGVASNSPLDWVAGHLGRLGLLHHFEHIRTIEDVKRGKPEPDIYLAAIDAFGFRPDEALALEDSPNGSRAAKSAGLFCLAVPNPMTRHLDWSHVDLRLDSLAEMELEQALAALGKA